MPLCGLHLGQANYPQHPGNPPGTPPKLLATPHRSCCFCAFCCGRITQDTHTHGFPPATLSITLESSRQGMGPLFAGKHRPVPSFPQTLGWAPLVCSLTKQQGTLAPRCLVHTCRLVPTDSRRAAPGDVVPVGQAVTVLCLGTCCPSHSALHSGSSLSILPPCWAVSIARSCGMTL